MPVSSVERPVSALRQRMLEDMAMRGLRSDTQHDYVRVVRSFAAFLGQPPDTATLRIFADFRFTSERAGYSRPRSTAPFRLSASSSL
jgi:integrase/recombinase XerD